MQGRAIRAQAVDLLLAYGRGEAAFGGRTLVRFDRDTRHELEAEHPELRSHLEIHAVLATATVVTVCHDGRHSRRRRSRRRLH
jgi:hypothetical protein